jgi:hypothetical protein
MNLLYGLIFYQIGTSTYGSDDNLNYHFGALMMLQTFALMMAEKMVDSLASLMVGLKVVW